MFRLVRWSALFCAPALTLLLTETALARMPGYLLFGPPNIARAETPNPSRLRQYVYQHQLPSKGPKWQPPSPRPRAYAYGWFGARPQPQFQNRGSYYGNYRYSGSY